jgi:16S rRNA (guanine966-N2)-methyltransferase
MSSHGYRSVIITGGSLRGRAISSPRGQDVRPTSSKVRQAFFNILNGRQINARFLDLFAGSGLMGFEAISRGAANVTFVDKSTAQIKNIQACADSLSLDKSRVISIVRDSLVFLEHLPSASFDLIFVDPPYAAKLGSAILGIIAQREILSAEGMVVIEHLKNDELPNKIDDTLQLVQTRIYGQTGLSFYVASLGR